jgi:hypothetical protein
VVVGVMGGMLLRHGHARAPHLNAGRCSDAIVTATDRRPQLTRWRYPFFVLPKQGSSCSTSGPFPVRPPYVRPVRLPAGFYVRPRHCLHEGATPRQGCIGASCEGVELLLAPPRVEQHALQRSK